MIIHSLTAIILKTRYGTLFPIFLLCTGIFFITKKRKRCSLYNLYRIITLQTLVYRDGNLISGPLEALIQHMVPTDTYYPDRTYLFAFLLSSRLFIKPHELLANVRSLCESQQGLGNAGVVNHAGVAKFAEHLVQLLAEWTEIFPYDFR